MISNLVLARHCTFSPSMLWHRANRCQMLFNALKFGASISSHSHGFALNRFSKLSIAYAFETLSPVVGAVVVEAFWPLWR